ncbi:MAG: RNA repair transcriptional activator RtcR [Hyphomicrobiaceae bacterium]|nr:RNA repair transcriptional activator RtcR [Hyphomicrobiaceae bacterium]
MRKTVVIGFLGTTLDRRGKGERWQHWRPSIAACQHGDLLIDRYEMLRAPKERGLAQRTAQDMRQVSPETDIRFHDMVLSDPWDFGEVYGALHDFARGYDFKPDEEDYLIQIVTGTHVAQICLFLLTESRHMPGRLLQLSPSKPYSFGAPGTYRIIDLDLSKYDRLASRFSQEVSSATSFLKAGIKTREPTFNAMIDEIERVALRSDAPILLTGPTGAGKTQLARRIFDLKKSRHLVAGDLVEINCATLRGDQAMSTLFGHKKGSFTGALADRDGLLKAAHGGILFLDEIGELGLDEQAMLLVAIEEGRFMPVGSDKETSSDFLLIAGTNRDLGQAVQKGRFREDLLARINLWRFKMPGLAERRADIEPNLYFELERFGARTGEKVSFNKEAAQLFLKFALSSDASWRGNFRDLGAAVTRMATLSTSGRIGSDIVRAEITRLSEGWREMEPGDRQGSEDILSCVLSPEQLAETDPFDKPQLAYVIKTCRQSKTLSEAGRKLFAASRQRRKTNNDADRLRKYLTRFKLDWQAVQ